MRNLLITKVLFFTSLVFSLNYVTGAQPITPAQPGETVAAAPQNISASKPDETQTRIKQLESQVETMRAEIDALKKLVTQSQTVDARDEIKASVISSTRPENQTGEKIVATSAQQENIPTETKQPAQQKQLGLDIGAARLTPYGTIYFNAFGNGGGTNNSDVPLFATPARADNVGASVRQTRLGVKLEGAKVGNSRLSAVLEADFFGGFPAVGIGENFGIVRLRLANARLDWEKTSVTIGQDWMVFAPVNPTSLAAAAIPQMAAAGNNWARLPQIKFDRKLNKNLTWQGAVLAPQTGDYSTSSTFFLQPTSGAASRVPFFQSRVFFADTNWFETKKAGSVGFSAHYGRSKIFAGPNAVGNNLESVGLALDWNFPLSERLSLSGEAFFGGNLGGFQAGVFQGYNSDSAYRNGSTLVAGGARSIGTRGGWAQLALTPDVLQNRLSFYGSIGIDDPRDEDLVSRTPLNFRTQNFVYALDAIYKFTTQFQIGAEFRRFQTLYVLSGRRNANHFNLSAAYSF